MEVPGMIRSQHLSQETCESMAKMEMTLISTEVHNVALIASSDNAADVLDAPT